MQPYLGPFMGGAAPMLVGSPTAGLAAKPAPAYSRQPKGTSVERVNVSCNGVKAVFMVHTQTIVCRCPTCTENGQLSRTMSPTEFERHSGMQSSKKWRRSIKVDMGRDSVSLGRWLEQNGYKSSTPAGMTPPVVGQADNSNSNNNNSPSQPISQSLSPSIMLMPQPMMDPATMQPVLVQQQIAAGGMYAPLLNPMGAMSPIGVSAAASAKPKKRKQSTGTGQHGSGAAASSVGNAAAGGVQDEEDLLAADALNLLRHRDSSSEDNHEAGSAGAEHGDVAQPESGTLPALANGVDQASPASARLSADHYKPSSSKETPRADAQSMSPLMKHRLANTTAVLMLKAAANNAPSNVAKAGKALQAGNGKASARAANSGAGSQSHSDEQASHTDGIETGGEQEPAADGRASRRRQQQQKAQPRERDGQGEGAGEGGITGNLLSNHHHRPSNSHRIGHKHVAVQNQLMAAQAAAAAAAAASKAGMWQVPNAGFMAPVSPMGMMPGSTGSDAAAMWDNSQGDNRKRKSGSASSKKRSGKRAQIDDDDVDVDDDIAAGEDEAAGSGAVYDVAAASQQQDAMRQDQPGSGRGDVEGPPRKKKKKARAMAMPMGMAMMGPGFPGMRPYMMHPYMMGPMMAGHPAMMAQQQQQQQMMAAVQQPNGAGHAMMMPPGMMWGPWGAYPAYSHGMLPSQPSPMVGMMPAGFNPFSQRDSGEGAHPEHVVSRAGRSAHVAKREDSHEWVEEEEEGEGEGDEEEQAEEEEEGEDEVGNSRRRNQGALEWDVDCVKEEGFEQGRPGRKIRKHMTTALLKHALQPLISGSVEAVGNSMNELAVTAYCPYAEFKGVVKEIGAK